MQDVPRPVQQEEMQPLMDWASRANLRATSKAFRWVRHIVQMHPLTFLQKFRFIRESRKEELVERIDVVHEWPIVTLDHVLRQRDVVSPPDHWKPGNPWEHGPVQDAFINLIRVEVTGNVLENRFNDPVAEFLSPQRNCLTEEAENLLWECISQAPKLRYWYLTDFAPIQRLSNPGS